MSGLTHKPTVNQILSGAIEEIGRLLKDESFQVHPDVKPAARAAPRIDLRDAMRSSPLFASMVLDENNCILEASSAMLKALEWPGTEESIKGQYLMSVMHPDDAVTLMSEATSFRSSAVCDNSVQALKAVVSFCNFKPLQEFEPSFVHSSGSGCFAFPQGYAPVVVIDVAICKTSMFLSITP